MRGAVNNQNSKVAFTLAEILITLGIIGVVAAMTLPSLIANYRKQTYVTQLQKTVSTLEQGFKKALADDGVDELENTELLSEAQYFGGRNISEDSGLTNELKKYFKIIDIGHIYDYTVFYLNGKRIGSAYLMGIGTITLVDGSILYIQYLSKKPMNQGYGNGYFVIDINGEKKPNQFGRDIFGFVLNTDGRLLPLGSEGLAVLPSSWKTESRLCGEQGKKIDNSVFGDGCAARIIENGWKMDY